jgi:hypothetical protein
MNPPDLVDGRIPVVLYNLGGSLMNLLTALLVWGLTPLVKDVPLLSVFFVMFALVGLGFALINGIPLRLAAVTMMPVTSSRCCRIRRVESLLAADACQRHPC